MKVISWNLLHGQPPLPEGPNSELRSIFANLDCDLLGVQEVDENQPRTDGARQVEEIAKASGAKDWAYARALIGTPGGVWRKPVGDESELQSSQSSPSYGIGMISKIAVKKWHRLDLGKSWIGMPLAVGDKKGMRLMYIKDEPRVCIIAELENGFTVATTHLSFVPFVNYFQLRKIQRFMAKLPGTHLLLGDLNLGWNLPEKLTPWRTLGIKNTYPSWKPAIQFDYIMSKEELDYSQITMEKMAISDHIPLAVEIKRQVQ